MTFNGGAIIKGGFHLFTIRDSSNGNSSVRDLAENHLDGAFYGSFPSGNGINGSDFVAELQAGATTCSRVGGSMGVQQLPAVERHFRHHEHAIRCFYLRTATR